jgi:hypothetical protein
VSQSLARRLLEHPDLPRDAVESALRTDPRPCWLLELIGTQPGSLSLIEAELEKMGPAVVSGVAPDWTRLAMVPPQWCNTWLAVPLGGDWGGSTVVGAVEPTAVGLGEQLHFLFGRETKLARIRLSTLLVLLPRLQTGTALEQGTGARGAARTARGMPALPAGEQRFSRGGGATQPGIPAPAHSIQFSPGASRTSPGMPATSVVLPARTQPGVAAPPQGWRGPSGQPTVRSPGGLPRPMVSVPSDADISEEPPMRLVRRLRRTQVPELIEVAAPPMVPAVVAADLEQEAPPTPLLESPPEEPLAPQGLLRGELPVPPHSVLEPALVLVPEAAPVSDNSEVAQAVNAHGAPGVSPLEFIAEATSPREATDRALVAVASLSRVAMVFRIRSSDFQLMESRGCGNAQLTISAELPSVLATAVKVGAYTGALPGGPAHGQLGNMLQPTADEEVTVSVLRVAGRPTLALLALGTGQSELPRMLEEIASITGDTLSLLLRRRKQEP